MANTTPSHFSEIAPPRAATSFDFSAAKNGQLSEDQLRHCSEAVNCFQSKMRSLETIHNEFQIIDQQQNRMVVLGKKDKFSISPRIAARTAILMSCHTLESVSRFIATQGPLPHTSKTWEMILQHRCPAIVMLTGLVDHNNNVKCGDYFQTEDDEPREFGNISICTKWIQTTDASLILRCIEVKNKTSEEPPFSVMHILYPDWPDHGVPETTTAVREIFHQVCDIPCSLGPIIVHCSAGIGRTGTYCAIHNIIQRVLIGDTTALDLATIVSSFRSQRVGMVQTRDQYVFC